MRRTRLALLSTACGEPLCGQAENNDGGYAKASLDDASVIAAADFAAAEISEDDAASYDLICAQTQVVAGTNYRLGFELEDVTWQAVVYEDLDGLLELSESTEIP